MRGPVILTAADGGTQQAPITYAAWPEETPVISGGVAISGWTKLGDGPLWTTTVPAVQSGDCGGDAPFVSLRVKLPSQSRGITDACPEFAR